MVFVEILDGEGDVGALEDRCPGCGREQGWRGPQGRVGGARGWTKVSSMTLNFSRLGWGCTATPEKWGVGAHAN